MAYRCAKFHLDPSSRLAAIDMDRKLGAAVPPFFFFLGGELGRYLTQCGLGRGLPPYQMAF